MIIYDYTYIYMCVCVMYLDQWFESAKNYLHDSLHSGLRNCTHVAFQTWELVTTQNIYSILCKLRMTNSCGAQNCFIL